MPSAAWTTITSRSWIAAATRTAISGGVAIAGADATPALELPARRLPLMAHVVDHPRLECRRLQPGREGVAQIVGTVRIDRNKVGPARATARW